MGSCVRSQDGPDGACPSAWVLMSPVGVPTDGSRGAAGVNSDPTGGLGGVQAAAGPGAGVTGMLGLAPPGPGAPRGTVNREPSWARPGAEVCPLLPCPLRRHRFVPAWGHPGAFWV